MNNLFKRLPSLEYLLPLTYLILAIGILAYQKLVPDYTSALDLFTGAIHIRTSDWMLVVCSIPSWPFLYLLNILFGYDAIHKNETIKHFMIWQYIPGHLGQFSITIFFIITPFCYYLLGLIIKKIIFLKSTKKPDQYKY